MESFYFVGYLSKRAEQQYLADLYDTENVELISDDLYFRSKWKSFLFEKAFRLRRIKDKDPFYLAFFDDCYALGNISFNQDGLNYIVLFDSAITKMYSESFFRKLKHRYSNIRLILYIYDEMNRPYSPRILRMSKLADRVFCTIPSDCSKYGFEYWPLMHSDISASSVDESISSDIYFMGNDGGRYGTLREIYKYLTAGGCVCDFSVAGDLSDAARRGGRRRHRNRPQFLCK